MITIPEVRSQSSNTIKLKEVQSKKKSELLAKCEHLVNQANLTLQNNIFDGKVEIREKPLHIQAKTRQQQHSFHTEGNIRDKISSLNTDLKGLQERIHHEKEEQRLKQEEKRKQAAIMIERLKKEKQEYRNKIKFNEMNSRLKNSVFSDQVLNMMKEQREKLVENKKKNMEERIQEHVNRKIARQEENVKNQLQYWGKIKDIESHRHKSTKILPKIGSNHQLEVNLRNDHRSMLPKKNTIIHKKSKSKQDFTDYQQIVNRYLERAKARKQNLSDRSPNRESLKSSKINDANAPEYSSLKIEPTKKSKAKKIILSYTQSQQKRIGDEYLKQSKEKASKKQRTDTLENESVDESMQLKGNAIMVSKNDKISSLETRWQKILSNVLNQKIDKAKAIEMFGFVQKKLDKLDPSGIEARLRRKLRVFQEISHHNRYDNLGSSGQKSSQVIEQIEGRQNSHNEFQQSSEHGI